MATLKLPIGIYTYLMTRALGALSKVHGGLAAGVCGMVGCSTTTGAVICRILSLTFLATDMMAFWVAAGTLYTDSFSYSIACQCLCLLASQLG